MKTLFIQLIAIVTMLMSNSCVAHTADDFGPSEKQNVSVSHFDELHLSSALRVVYVESATPKVTLEGPKELLKHIAVEQKGSVLTLSCQDETFRHRSFSKDPLDLVTITVQSPGLRSVWMSGATKLKAKQMRTGGDFFLTVSGASNLELESLRCKKAQLSVSGASEVEIDKTACTDIEWQISGASNVEQEGLEARSFIATLGGASNMEATLSGVETTEVKASGASNAEFHFNRCGTAQANATGASNIELSGLLRSLSKSASGGSNIDTKELKTAQ